MSPMSTIAKWRVLGGNNGARYFLILLAHKDPGPMKIYNVNYGANSDVQPPSYPLSKRRYCLPCSFPK